MNSRESVPCRRQFAAVALALAMLLACLPLSAHAESPCCRAPRSRSYSHSARSSHGSRSRGYSVGRARAPRYRAPRYRAPRAYHPRVYHPPRHRAARSTVHRVRARRVARAPGSRDRRGRLVRSERAKDRFERLTGHPHGWPGHVVDHIIPLACGGPDDPTNMQWQTTAEGKAKDKVERKQCGR